MLLTIEKKQMRLCYVPHTYLSFPEGNMISVEVGVGFVVFFVGNICGEAPGVSSPDMWQSIQPMGWWYALKSIFSHSANGPWKKKFELYFPY